MIGKIRLCTKVPARFLNVLASSDPWGGHMKLTAGASLPWESGLPKVYHVSGPQKNECQRYSAISMLPSLDVLRL